MFLLFDVKQHDHENNEHHDRAGVDDHLHGRDKRRCQHQVQAGQRNEDADQRDGAVERMALRHHCNRAADCQSGKKYEEKRSRHRLSAMSEYGQIQFKNTTVAVIKIFRIATVIMFMYSALKKSRNLIELYSV